MLSVSSTQRKNQQLSINNITLTLDDKLISRVKQIAVREETSVSAWVSSLSESPLRDRDAFEAAKKGALDDLNQPLHPGALITQPIAGIFMDFKSQKGV
jgi:hypothetical protein